MSTDSAYLESSGATAPESMSTDSAYLEQTGTANSESCGAINSEPSDSADSDSSLGADSDSSLGADSDSSLGADSDSGDAVNSDSGDAVNSDSGDAVNSDSGDAVNSDSSGGADSDSSGGADSDSSGGADSDSGGAATSQLTSSSERSESPDGAADSDFSGAAISQVTIYHQRSESPQSREDVHDELILEEAEENQREAGRTYFSHRGGDLPRHGGWDDTGVTTGDGTDEVQSAFGTEQSDIDLHDTQYLTAPRCIGRADTIGDWKILKSSFTDPSGDRDFSLKAFSLLLQSSSGSGMYHVSGQANALGVVGGLVGIHRSTYLYNESSTDPEHLLAMELNLMYSLEHYCTPENEDTSMPIWTAESLLTYSSKIEPVEPISLSEVDYEIEWPSPAYGVTESSEDDWMRAKLRVLPKGNGLTPVEKPSWEERFAWLRAQGPCCNENPNNLLQMFLDNWSKTDEPEEYGPDRPLIQPVSVTHTTFGFHINLMTLLPPHIAKRLQVLIGEGCSNMTKFAPPPKVKRNSNKRQFKILDRYNSTIADSMSLVWQSRILIPYPVRLRMLDRLKSPDFGVHQLMQPSSSSREDLQARKAKVEQVDQSLMARKEFLMMWFGEYDVVPIHCDVANHRLCYETTAVLRVKYVPWAVKARRAVNCRKCSSCLHVTEFPKVVVQVEEGIKDREYITRLELESRPKYRGTKCRQDSIHIPTSNSNDKSMSNLVEINGCIEHDCPEMLKGVGKYGSARSLVAPLSQGFFPYLASMFLVIRHYELLDELSRSRTHRSHYDALVANLERSYKNPLDKSLHPLLPAALWGSQMYLPHQTCRAILQTTLECRRVLEYRCSAIHKSCLSRFPGLEQNVFPCILKGLSTVTVLTDPLSIESWLLDNIYAPLQIQPSINYARRWLSFHSNVLRDPPDALLSMTVMSYMAINRSWLHPCHAIPSSTMPMRDVSVPFEYPNFPRILPTTTWAEVADYFAKEAARDYYPGVTALYHPHILIDIRCTFWENTTPCGSSAKAATESLRINTPHALVISTGSRIAYIPLCEYTSGAHDLRSLTLLTNTKANYEDVYLARFNHAGAFKPVGVERSPLLRDFLASSKIKKLVNDHPAKIAKQLLFCGLPVQGLVPIIPDIRKRYARPTEYPISWYRFTIYDMWTAIRELVPIFALQVYYSCFLVGAGVECQDWRRLPDFAPGAVFEAVEKDSTYPHLLRCGDVREPMELKESMNTLKRCLDVEMMKFHDFVTDVLGVGNDFSD